MLHIRHQNLRFFNKRSLEITNSGKIVIGDDHKKGEND